MPEFKRISSLLLVVMALTLACSPKTKTCTISKVSFMGNLQTEFIFSNNRLATVMVYTSTGQMSNYFNIAYDGQGRVDYVDIYVGSPLISYRRKCYYDPNGNLGSIYTLNDSNGDNIPDNLLNHVEYAYDSDHQMTEFRAYNSSGTFIYNILYTWSNGNLTSNGAIGTPHSENDYDDKKNVYGEIKLPYFICTLTPEMLSKNNVALVTYYDAANVVTSSTSFNFSYDADGYPISETLNSQTFEYSCIEE